MDSDVIEKINCLEKRQAINSEKIEVANHRIDDLENETKNNRELIVAVRELTIEVRHMREEQSAMKKEHEVINDRIKNIEDKPAKNWDKVTTTIIGTIVGAIAGAMIGLILK